MECALKRWLRRILATAGLLLLAVPAAAEFKVNSFTPMTGVFSGFMSCYQPDGNLVVIWGHNQYDAIWGRRLSPLGVPLGPEFIVTSPGYGGVHSVTCRADGSFLVTWGVAQIKARLFDATGASLGGEIAVANGSSVDACADATGAFIVVFVDGTPQYWARRFDSSGTALGAAFTIAGTPARLGCFADGSFVGVWSDAVHNLAQRYDNTGATIGAQFQLDSLPNVAIQGPGICTDSSGGFVVAWERYVSGTGPVIEVDRRVFDNTGTPLAPESNVAAHPGSSHRLPAIACNPAGGFSVAWYNEYAEECAQPGVYVRRFDATGAPLTEDLPLFPCERPQLGVLFQLAAGPSGAWAAVLESFDHDILARLSVEGDLAPCYVGDNVVDAACGESCDDGNRLSCDGCSQLGAAETGYVCGDGTVNAACGEQCDDANALAGDGCGACATERTASSNLGPGQSISTDGGAGTSAAFPVATSVTTPNGGTVSIVESGATPGAPGLQALARVVQITAPPASVASPLVFTFGFDNSIIPAGVDAASLEIRRNGVALGDCTGAPQAIPDPCIASRQSSATGYEFTILTSAASEWRFGVPLCRAEPRDDCRLGGKAILTAKKHPTDASKDKLSLSWLKGVTELQEFGDPVNTSNTSLCLYANGALVSSAHLTPGGTCGTKSCWKSQLGGKGYNGKLPDGSVKAVFRTGNGKGKVIVKAGGASLTLPAPPLSVPLTAQIVGGQTGVCWSDSFTAAELRRNDTPTGAVGVVKGIAVH